MNFDLILDALFAEHLLMFLALVVTAESASALKSQSCYENGIILSVLPITNSCMSSSNTGRLVDGPIWGQLPRFVAIHDHNNNNNNNFLKSNLTATE